MIRNENVSVSINGNVSHAETINIQNSINKAYSSCIINGLKLAASVGDNLTVIINGQSFDFVIVEINYQPFSKISISAFGLPYVLENKEVVSSSTIYEDSDSLIENNRGSIVVVNNIPNIVFSDVIYKSNGSVLTSFIDMLNVIGGEYYEINGSLYLDKLKTIDINETVFKTYSGSEIFSYSYTDKSVLSEKIKNVLINPITNDIYSTPVINIDFDDENNKGYILFNPSIKNSFEYKLQGLSVSEIKTIYYTETIVMNDETVLKTLGSIDAIIELQLDGVAVSETDYEDYPTHNKLRFLNKISGEITIKYQTNVLQFKIYKNTNVSIKYKNAILQTELAYFTNQKTDDATNIEIPDDIIVDDGGGVVRILPPFVFGNKGSVLSTKDLKYDIIFSDGHDENFKHIELLTTYNNTINVYAKYNDGKFWDTSFLYNATVEEVADIVIEKFKVSLTPNGTYEYLLNDEMTAVNQIKADGNIISDTQYRIVSNVFYLDDENLKNAVFDISYRNIKNKITFDLPTPDNNVSRIETRVDNYVSSLDFINPKTNLCVVPSLVTINVAEQLNVSVASAHGGHIGGDFGDLTVDYFGNVEVYVTNKRLYVLDTNSIVPYSSITIDARGVI